MPQLTDDEARAFQRMLDRAGDQRAKDLIDKNDGEMDSRCATYRLHRALSYGRTSIQAGEAFQKLGMAYEDLGNVRLAIKYYTASIDLKRTLGIEPVPSLYERGDLAAARRDFAEAVELEGQSFWFPQERELADRVLTESVPDTDV